MVEEVCSAHGSQDKGREGREKKSRRERSRREASMHLSVLFKGRPPVI